MNFFFTLVDSQFLLSSRAVAVDVRFILTYRELTICIENIGENFSTNGTDFFWYRNQLYHLQNTCKFFAFLKGSLVLVIHTNFEEIFSRFGLTGKLR